MSKEPTGRNDSMSEPPDATESATDGAAPSTGLDTVASQAASGTREDSDGGAHGSAAALHTDTTTVASADGSGKTVDAATTGSSSSEASAKRSPESPGADESAKSVHVSSDPGTVSSGAAERTAGTESDADPSDVPADSKPAASPETPAEGEATATSDAPADVKAAAQSDAPTGSAKATTSSDVPATGKTPTSADKASEQNAAPAAESGTKLVKTAGTTAKESDSQPNSTTGALPPMTPVADRSGPPGAPPIPKWRRVSYPPAVVPAAAIAGVSAAVLIPWDRPGIGWVLAGVVAAGAVFVVDRRARGAVEQGESTDRSIRALLRRNPARLWWTALALALLAVGAVRAAGWLFVLCLLAAVFAGSLAVVPRRSVHGIWYDAIAVPLEATAAVLWVSEGSRRARDARKVRTWRAGLSVGATVALLAVFAPLLGSADATFGSMLNRLVPTVEPASLLRWTLVSGLVALGSFGAMYLLAGPPMSADSMPREKVSGRTVSRWEWALPVGALTALFAAFVAAQFAALFGGDDYVQKTAGLTYAQYARSGFWQLSIVTMLALAVILAVLRFADQDSARDRTWLRALLGSVTALSLLLVASALGRMWTYQQAYGFTVLRVLVEAFELWLGLMYVLVLAAVLRLRRAWLPRAALGTAFATLLVLALLNPERLVADRNIDRWTNGKTLDTDYLSTLSPDVVPALDRLPEPLRAEILEPIRDDLPEDTWQSWNLSRASAR
ncbi:DUF4153 domain-containing protein [Nocardia amikacinitolerans]|uniref:DUF4153 domain-containing protein n=1 Tax=Nocardia amikacinitolerans TaxID=756689 RepID=UPI0020A4272E|nr:DUF4153 domain-containing protein [Nocardia amikacinitolerans]MCP2279439.1 protein of unknown function (DUF4173) [Nocardia amikacinitolerans]